MFLVFYDCLIFIFVNCVSGSPNERHEIFLILDLWKRVFWDFKPSVRPVSLRRRQRPALKFPTKQTNRWESEWKCYFFMCQLFYLSIFRLFSLDLQLLEWTFLHLLVWNAVLMNDWCVFVNIWNVRPMYIFTDKSLINGLYPWRFITFTHLVKRSLQMSGLKW